MAQVNTASLSGTSKQYYSFTIKRVEGHLCVGEYLMFLCCVFHHHGRLGLCVYWGTSGTLYYDWSASSRCAVVNCALFCYYKSVALLMKLIIPLFADLIFLKAYLFGKVLF